MSVDVDEQVEKDTLEASEGPVQPAGESLRLKVIRGASWELIGQFAMQFIRFGGNLILTRLLLPDAFGVMGMVQVFMISLTLLADVGLHVSVMYDPRGDDDDFLNTVWSVSLVRGLLLFGVSCLFAYPFAHFYGMPDLVWLIPITGLSSIFRGASSTSLLSAGRHLQRKWSVTVECGSQIAGSIITVILTLITCSVYGLAWGWVVTSIIYFVMSFCDSARRPHRFHWDNEIVRSLTSYGRWLWLCGGLTILTQQSDRLTLGTMITAGVLGNYVIGKNLASLPMIIFYRIMSGIAQPLYASIQHLDSKEFRRKARKLRLGILVTHMPVLFGMAILGKPLVNLLYEGSYSEAGWFCTISAIGSMFIVATDMGDVFASFGDGRTHFKLTFVRSLGLAISLSVGCLVGQHFGHADHGVLFGIMLAPLVYYPIQSIFYRSIGVWLPDIDAIGLSVPLLMLFCLYMGWI